MQHNYQVFIETVWEFYNQNKRVLPWRLPNQEGIYDPYKVLVSEIMLQQTQVSRVVPKYQMFLERFPTIDSLAMSTLGDVLVYWQGLGYNKRAKYLWQAAQHLCTIPTRWTTDDLIQYSGIGPNTAGAVVVYAYNQPVVFIETNIRSVFIYHFFKDANEHIRDTQIYDLVQETLDTEHPREWYYALMDYGSYLKKTSGNHARKSAYYVKQSPFEGSSRQLRGLVLRHLTQTDLTQVEIQNLSKDIRIRQIVDNLIDEGLVCKTGKLLHLPK